MLCFFLGMSVCSRLSNLWPLADTYIHQSNLSHEILISVSSVVNVLTSFSILSLATCCCWAGDPKRSYFLSTFNWRIAKELPPQQFSSVEPGGYTFSFSTDGISFKGVKAPTLLMLLRVSSFTDSWFLWQIPYLAAMV